MKTIPLALRIQQVYLKWVYGIAFFIAIVDIPYFHHYFNRLTTGIFQWTSSPRFMFLMVVQDWVNYLYFLLFFVSIWAFARGIDRIFSRLAAAANPSFTMRQHLAYSGVALLCVGVCILAIRGRIAKKSPIRVGTAYFSNYAFPNQVGLNPVFTLLRSYLDGLDPINASLHLADSTEAIRFATRELGAGGTQLPGPIARLVPSHDSSARKLNVVVVIMESMSAEKLTRFGNPNHLTPVLDSLYRISYGFDHVYSAGIHTMNGIYSTLFGMPALLKQHPMNASPIPRMAGFSNVLKANGYSTTYFTTHDDQFDNVGGFLSANDFEHIVAQKDYPEAAIKSTLGVPDHFMFSYAIPELNTLAHTGKPFFAALMTASDHSPYILPDGIPFKPHTRGIRMQIVEYADWSIGQFLRQASRQSWYGNTVFVFVADHGQLVGTSPFDTPLSFNHIPLIIHAPKHIKPKVFDCLGGQIDIFPTVMGILDIPYVNNTMGIDLLHQTRPYMYYNFDDKVGVLDHNYLFVYRQQGKPTLYRYHDKKPVNLYKQQKALAGNMWNYGRYMMQTAQEMLTRKKTGLQ